MLVWFGEVSVTVGPLGVAEIMLPFFDVAALPSHRELVRLKVVDGPSETAWVHPRLLTRFVAGWRFWGPLVDERNGESSRWVQGEISAASGSTTIAPSAPPAQPTSVGARYWRTTTPEIVHVQRALFDREDVQDGTYLELPLWREGGDTSVRGHMVIHLIGASRSGNSRYRRLLGRVVEATPHGGQERPLPHGEVTLEYLLPTSGGAAHPMTVLS
ncbi:MAG TPA: hypothetical protein VLI05_06870 [Candidatus Saccharimonadia bacterium]|nr:hypothetical protein [Candidatus Saccharimonadia bacterium]